METVHRYAAELLFMAAMETQGGEWQPRTHRSRHSPTQTGSMTRTCHPTLGRKQTQKVYEPGARCINFKLVNTMRGLRGSHWRPQTITSTAIAVMVALAVAQDRHSADCDGASAAASTLPCYAAIKSAMTLD